MPPLALTWTANADWYQVSAVNQDITGVSWPAGARVVVVGLTEGPTATLTTPSNSFLSFTQDVSVSVTSGEANAYLWSSPTLSAQTNQTITSNKDASTSTAGIGCWVIHGYRTLLGASGSNRDETQPSVNCQSGSVLVCAWSDFNAIVGGATIATGTGTQTERMDLRTNTKYAVWSGDWVETTTGATNYGCSAGFSGASRVATQVWAEYKIAPPDLSNVRHLYPSNVYANQGFPVVGG